jgi:hypothetical protein
LALSASNFKTVLDTLNECGIIFSYNGPISDQLIGQLSDIFRSERSFKTKRDFQTTAFFSSLVEQTQNIVRYSDDSYQDHNGDDIGYGVVVVGEGPLGLYICTGNRVLKSKQQKLEDSLNQLSKLDQKQLRVEYREQRRQRLDAENDGSGLGFLEMFRRSSAPVEFNFFDLDKEYALFSLKVTV